MLTAGTWHMTCPTSNYREKIRWLLGIDTNSRISPLATHDNLLKKLVELLKKIPHPFIIDNCTDSYCWLHSMFLL